VLAVVLVIAYAAGWTVRRPHNVGMAFDNTKGVVSGTLVLAGGPTEPTPVAGDVHIVNVLQIGGGQAYLPGVTTAADGSFSEIVDPGLYEVSGTSPVYWGGRRSCTIPGQTVRVRAGDAVSVNVECRTR
jgi:hypothetical protein